MEMQGTRQLKVQQQQAWDALNNPEVLKACIPGCDRIEVSGENQFNMGTALKIGPVSAKFTGKIMLTDMNPPASYTLNFEGQGGVAGFGKGTAKVTLTPNADGCELSYSVTAQVGGKIAQLGQRLIDGVAKSLSEEFFKRFDAETEKLDPPPAAAVAVSQPEAAAEEPKGWPTWVWVAAALVVAGLVYVAR
ncbi:MAG: carbon monoxide dehydrogenase subunit G [Alphaproteobacteria bacterium]|nr:carbon monoxide dehydrogenase subunit G [Alphaproteobacteria bacterium]